MKTLGQHFRATGLADICGWLEEGLKKHVSPPWEVSVIRTPTAQLGVLVAIANEPLEKIQSTAYIDEREELSFEEAVIVLANRLNGHIAENLEHKHFPFKCATHRVFRGEAADATA